MRFDGNHLKAFAESVNADLNVDDLDGSNARAFAVGVPGADPQKLPDRQLDRSTLKTLINEPDTDTLTACLGIIAWGRMHRGNRDHLFKNGDTGWLEIASDVRGGKLDRIAAYDAFRTERNAKRLKGMGPAYYTKLIHFLLPRRGDGEPQGYIMDQWAGCSLNLLVGEPIVWMNSNCHCQRTRDGLKQSSTFTVSDANTGGDYDRFCRAVEVLVTHFSKCGDKIDRALMSTGGRKRLPWRAYVMEHRRP